MEVAKFTSDVKTDIFVDHYHYFCNSIIIKNIMADSSDLIKRKQFGNRVLKNEDDVFKHNAWWEKFVYV